MGYVRTLLFAGVLLAAYCCIQVVAYNHEQERIGALAAIEQSKGVLQFMVGAQEHLSTNLRACINRLHGRLGPEPQI